MSIDKFTASLKDKSNTQVLQSTKDLLDDFAKSADAAFKAGGMSKAASVMSEGSATVNGKKVQLSESFRSKGEKQGRTRLILTEDDLGKMFDNLNISYSESPMILYAKYLATSKFSKYSIKHYEIYTRDGVVTGGTGTRPRQTLGSAINVESSDSVIGIKPENIIAIRGLNFSHRNTLTHVADFIHSLNVLPGTTKDIEKLISAQYDRGHVYAQTTGRAIVSAKDIANEENIINSIIGLYKLLDEGSSSLTEHGEKYKELLARAQKDFTGNNLFMNIQLQLKVGDGLGNRETGEISAAIRIVKFLQNLIKGSNLSSDGKRQLGVPLGVSIKEFESLLADFKKKLSIYKDKINTVLTNTSNPNYLYDLETSKSLKTFITDSLIDTIKGKGIKALHVKTPFIKAVSVKNSSKKVKPPGKSVLASLEASKQSLNKLKAEVLKQKVVSSNIFPIVGQELSLINLQNLLNSHLQDVISANMGDGDSRNVLNYRTGRLAASAKVERLTSSREGLITAFYSYQKNPYATFSEGGRQQYPKTRDPKLLISKSIREIAAEYVSNQLRSVNI